jgi:two-component sensor histidine kinase
MRDVVCENCARFQYIFATNLGYLRTPADHLRFDVGRNAIPPGLLMNVIVTNFAKHAYPEGSGEIRVSGERRGAELLGSR